MPNQIELKDAQQDQEIALLKHRVEQLEKEGPTSDQEIIKELRERVRKLEKTVWGASAVIAALITIAGIASALESKELPTIQSEVISHAENY
jgi:hypothetical protein